MTNELDIIYPCDNCDTPTRCGDLHLTENLNYICPSCRAKHRPPPRRTMRRRPRADDAMWATVDWEACRRARAREVGTL